MAHSSFRPGSSTRPLRREVGPEAIAWLVIAALAVLIAGGLLLLDQ